MTAVARLWAARPGVLRGAVGAGAFLFPVVGVLQDKLVPVVLFGLLAAVAVATRPWALRSWPPLLIGIAAFLAWGLLSSLWSLDPLYSLERFGRLASSVAGGLLLCHLLAARGAAERGPSERNTVERWLAAGLVAAGALVLLRYAWLSLQPPESLPRVIFWLSVLPYSATAVLSVFVLLAAMPGRPASPLALAAIAAAAGVTLIVGSGSSGVALIVGAVIYGAVLGFGRRFVRVLVVAAPILFLVGPLAVQAIDLPAQLAARGWTLDTSAAHRLIIWRYVTGKIAEKPLLGWGLQTARLLPGREAKADEDPRYADIRAVAHFWPGANIEVLPMHPHNATLHVLAELGAVGAVLYAAIYALCVLSLLRADLPRPVLAAGIGGGAALFMIGQLSFSAWQTWWVCTQFFAAALYLAVARRGGP